MMPPPKAWAERHSGAGVGITPLASSLASFLPGGQGAPIPRITNVSEGAGGMGGMASPYSQGGSGGEGLGGVPAGLGQSPAGILAAVPAPAPLRKTRREVIELEKAAADMVRDPLRGPMTRSKGRAPPKRAPPE